MARNTVFVYSIHVPKLVLNWRHHYGDRVLSDGQADEVVGYLARGGNRRYVRWLGFIDRAEARGLEGARPVRLADITRVGVDEWPSPAWHEVPAGMSVHGCLTSDGAYAVYDAVVALVGKPKA